MQYSLTVSSLGVLAIVIMILRSFYAPKDKKARRVLSGLAVLSFIYFVFIGFGTFDKKEPEVFLRIAPVLTGDEVEIQCFENKPNFCYEVAKATAQPVKNNISK